MPRTAKSKENASHQTKGAAKAASKSAKAAAPAPPPSAPPPALLTEAGLQRGADGSFLLADSFLFKQHVSRALRRGADNSTKDDLVAALAELWSEPAELRAALQPTRIAAADGAADGDVKDSLVRLLLQCDTLQTDLATWRRKSAHSPAPFPT